MNKSLNPVERRILVVTCFGHFMSHYNMLVFPAIVLPLAGVMDMEMAKVLGLSFWMYLLFGLSALPWGLIGDRWGGKTLMMVMFLGAGLSGLAAAFSVTSPTGLAIAMAGIGLFSGVYHPIGLGLISKGVGRLSVAMGYNAVFGGLGLVLAPLVSGIVNWLSGPMAVFVVLGLLNIAGIGIMAILPLGEAPKRTASTSASANGMLGAFLILLVAMMVGGMAYRGATVILPSYLELRSPDLLARLYGILGGEISGNLFATTVTAVVYTVGMIGQYIGGHVGERYEERYSYLFFHTMVIVPAFLMAFAWNLPLIGLAFVYFFFLLGMQPIENTLVARFTPERLHHSAYGMKFILTFGVGALAVKLAEWIELTWGVWATFIALGIMSLIIVTSIIALIRWTNHRATHGSAGEEAKVSVAT